MAASEDQNQIGTNNSSDENELEQYGVWVKAGPEDVDESETEESFALADLDDTALEAAGQELFGETTATAEELDIESTEAPTTAPPSDELELEEISLESLDEIAATGEEALAATPTEEPGGPGLTLDLDDELNMGVVEEPAVEPAVEPAAETDTVLSLEEEDLTLGIEGEAEELGVDVSPEIAEEPEPIAAEPMDLGDLEETLPASEEPEEFDLGELEEEAPEPQTEPAGLTGGEDSGEGVVDDSLPIEDELPEDLDDLTLDLESLDVDAYNEPETAQGEEPVEEIVGEEEAELVAELEEEGIPEAPVAEAEPEVAGIESVTAEIETEEPLDLSSLPEEPEADIGVSVDVDLGVEEEIPELEADDLDLSEGFDDLSAVEEDISVPSETIDLEAPPVGIGADDRLSHIERELAAIREEIREEIRNEIRSELGELKRELASLRAPAAAPAPTEGAESEEAAGGFFVEEEDEDETIALTGAELDNIMSSAEFTEQTGKSTDIEDLGPIPDHANEPETPSAPVQEISLEEDEEDLGSLDIELAEPAPRGPADQTDIDAELADIDELEDVTESISLEDVPELETEAPPILDAEPLETEIAPEQGALGGGEPAESVPNGLKADLRDVLEYMDQLLESLPEEKIREFAKSEHFKVYQRLFDELGLEQD
jgi:pilus assembly protein FimV